MSWIAHDAETSLIGAVLNHPELLDRWGAKVRPTDFAVQSCQRLWRMLRALWIHGRPVDIPSLVQTFPRQVERLGGAGKLAEIQYYCLVDVGTADRHFERLLELSARRRIANNLSTALTQIQDPATDFAEVVGRIQAAALEAAPAKDQEQEFREWYENLAVLRANPGAAWGVRTGWEDVDAITLGWHPGNLVIVGGRTSMGKSAFANECAIRAARAGKQVMIFSLEMSRREIWNRMAANLARIPLMRVKQGRIDDAEMRRINDAMNLMERIVIDDSRGVTSEQIIGEMRRVKHERGLDLVIVDYISEIVEPSQQSDNAGSALYRVTRKLRAAAQELHVPIIALSQIVRGVESRSDKRPTLSDLSGSSGIESGADLVILLYREDYYNPQTENRNILEVILAKNRNGPTGTVKLFYDSERQRILSLEQGG